MTTGFSASGLTSPLAGILKTGVLGQRPTSREAGIPLRATTLLFMNILAIETSCDETAAAVVKYDRGCFDISSTKRHKLHNQTQKNCSFKIISNIIASQVEIHSKYGGIVPEVAARQHVENIIPVVDEAMGKFKPDDIDAIAVVNGPGLITSLFVGVEAAKSLAWAWKKPLIAINHLEAHIYSAISQPKADQPRAGNFPALALIVSGGHTQLVLMKAHGKYEIVGETRDDAAGEAFDKVGKLLGLGYPGGPVVSRYAEQADRAKMEDGKLKIELPRPMIGSKDFDFSFSGLKTAVLYETRGKKLNKEYIASVCAEFQQAVIDVLATKTQKAANKYKVKKIILAGGVSANKELRKSFEKEFSEKLLMPGKGLSTDNAAMVGMAAAFHFEKKDFTKIGDLRVDPNLNF